MFKNLKLGLKLAIGFGLVVALLIIVAIIGILRVGQLDREIEDMVGDKYPKTVLANSIIDHVNEDARSLRNIIISDDPAERAKQRDRIDGNRPRYTEWYATLEKMIVSEEGKAQFKSVIDARTDYVKARDKALELAMAGQKAEAIGMLFGEVRKVQTPYFENLNKLIEFQGKLMEKSGQAAEALANSTRSLIIMLLLAALVIATGGAWLVTRSITRPIGEAVALARRMAEGDMSASVEVDSKD